MTTRAYLLIVLFLLLALLGQCAGTPETASDLAPAEPAAAAVAGGDPGAAR